MGEAQNSYTGWALVELFGHQKEAGFVTTEYFGTAAMFRIDVPGLDEREYELEQPEYTYDDNGRYVEIPSGSRVKRREIAPRTRLVGIGAVYGITPCSEELAKAQVERSVTRPLIILGLPPRPQIESGEVDLSELEDGF